jgi:hypothetical protein
MGPCRARQFKRGMHRVMVLFGRFSVTTSLDDFFHAGVEALAQVIRVAQIQTE